MQLDALLQLLFGLIATMLTLSGLWFKRQIFRSTRQTLHRSNRADVPFAACFYRRQRVAPLLPLYADGALGSRRRSTYPMEMNITQDWIGQHAAGWSVGQPRMHRIANGGRDAVTGDREN